MSCYFDGRHFLRPGTTKRCARFRIRRAENDCSLDAIIHKCLWRHNDRLKRLIRGRAYTPHRRFQSGLTTIIDLANRSAGWLRSCRSRARGSLRASNSVSPRRGAAAAVACGVTCDGTVHDVRSLRFHASTVGRRRASSRPADGRSDPQSATLEHRRSRGCARLRGA